MDRPTTVILALAALVAGCARQPAAEPPAPPVRPYHGGLIQVARWGVGPIRVGTAFSSARIRALFPDAVVRDGAIHVDPDAADKPGEIDEMMAVITVARNGQPLLEIDDGSGDPPGSGDATLGQVRALGGPVRAPGGERLGLAWSAARFDLSQCEIGEDEDAARVVCARPGDGEVTYVFAVPGWSSEEELPPDSLLRSRAYLSQIVWAPSPPRKPQDSSN